MGMLHKGVIAFSFALLTTTVGAKTIAAPPTASDDAVATKQIIEQNYSDTELKTIAYHIARLNAALSLYSPLLTDDGSGEQLAEQKVAYQCAQREIETCIENYTDKLANKYHARLSNNQAQASQIKNILLGSMFSPQMSALMNPVMDDEFLDNSCPDFEVAQCVMPSMELPAMSKLPRSVGITSRQLEADFQILGPQVSF
jgi:hypothetical protein